VYNINKLSMISREVGRDSPARQAQLEQQRQQQQQAAAAAAASAQQGKGGPGAAAAAGAQRPAQPVVREPVRSSGAEGGDRFFGGRESSGPRR